jgi:predicted dinucleotide-binding enzyme
MQIAVIGKGNVGGALASRWQQAGYQVVFGSRAADREALDGPALRSVADAIDGSDVVALAVPGNAIAQVLHDHGPALAGKVVIDAVNRMGQVSLNSREAISQAAPTARYVRAFNSLGWENFADPLPGADLFFAADPEARGVAEKLISAVGLRPVYVGDAEAGGAVDALLPVWFALVQQRGARRLAFRLVEQE